MTDKNVNVAWITFYNATPKDLKKSHLKSVLHKEENHLFKLSCHGLPEENVKLAGEPVFLLVHDCEVYRVDKSEKGEVQWTRVLAPEFYPFWPVCQREFLSFQAGVLTVTPGRMATGAGGCCATGGTYRSTDGRTWKKL